MGRAARQARRAGRQERRAVRQDVRAQGGSGREARQTARAVAPRVTRANESLRKVAAVAGLTPVGLAVKAIAKPLAIKRMKAFVKKNNPALARAAGDDPQKLAAATTQVAEDRATSMGGGGVPYDEMPEEQQLELDEQLLDEEEQDEETAFGDEENFLDPATLAAAKAVGKKVIGKIREKRAKKGKGFLGKMADGSPTKGGKTGSEIKEAIDEGVDVLEKEKTKQAVKEKAPVIIIVAVVLLAVGATIAYGVASKK